MSFLASPGPGELAEVAALPEGIADYQVLRRVLPFRRFQGSSADPVVRRDFFIDVEIGVDTESDEIIEIAMVSFFYSIEARVLGITDAMVADKSIDPSQVADFVGPAALIVAHNANFDRRFSERLFPIFAHKQWACSWREINWADEGFVNGTKLVNYLVASLGYFFDKHRPVNDCQAGIAVLADALPASGRSGMAALLESARKPRWRIRAIGGPFAHRDSLKSRRYRWHGGEGGQARAWFVDPQEEAVEGELAILHAAAYGREDAAIPVRHTAL